MKQYWKGYIKLGDDFYVHPVMVDVIFAAFGNGNGNRVDAAKWTLEFINKYQNTKICVSAHRGMRTMKNTSPCSICGKPGSRWSKELGLCEMHRSRLRRYGDPCLVKKKVGASWRLVREGRGIYL